MIERHPKGQAHPHFNTAPGSSLHHLWGWGLVWPLHKEIPVLRRGTDSPADAGRACQGQVRLRNKHNHLWPVHEAQAIVDTDMQAPLQDLQGAAIQQADPLQETQDGENEVLHGWEGTGQRRLGE